MSEPVPPAPTDLPLPLPQVLQDTLAANGGVPIVLEHPQTHERFVLRADQSDLPILRPENEERLRREVQKGIDDFEAGRCSEWNVEKVIAEAKARLESREQSK